MKSARNDFVKLMQLFSHTPVVVFSFGESRRGATFGDTLRREKTTIRVIEQFELQYAIRSNLKDEK